MANRYYKQFRYSLETSLVDLYAHIVTGSTGAIAVASSDQNKGFAITRTAAGEYKVKLEDNYNKIKAVNITPVGPNAGNYTTAKGLPFFIRLPAVPDVAISPLQLDTDGLQFFEIQFVDAADNTSEELPDNAEFLINITLKNSSLDF